MEKYGNEKRSTLFALDMMKGIWYLGTLPKLNLEHKSSKSQIYLVYSRKSGTSSNYFLHLENHFYMFDYFSYLQESFVHRTAGCQVKQTIVNNKNNPSLVWEHTWEYSNKNAKTKTQNKQKNNNNKQNIQNNTKKKRTKITNKTKDKIQKIIVKKL